MTRVFGQLFDDKRNGILALKASKSFFGSSRDEQHFTVVDGYVDFDISPTPRGIFYNVGFKDNGDIRSTIFTLKWPIPNSASLDVGVSSVPEPVEEPNSSVLNQVQSKRLANELSSALGVVQAQEREIADIKHKESALRQKFDQHKRDIAIVLAQRDQDISILESDQQLEVRTVYQRIPVLPKVLEQRIIKLEAENKRLLELNSTYYESYLELYQLKLERAQSTSFPDSVTETSGSPRQRLINKLSAK